MKTIKFDCNGHNAPSYGCNKPGDNSGEYVPAEVAQELHEALDYVAGFAMGGGKTFRDHPAVAEALAAADGEDI